MLAFLVTLIKVIAPWVAAAVVIHYLNVYNEKKYPEFYNSDNENNPKSLFEDFEIPIFSENFFKDINII